MWKNVACKCCGRTILYGGGYPVTSGKMHAKCWEEHHSDPEGPWPRDHKCKEES